MSKKKSLVGWTINHSLWLPKNAEILTLKQLNLDEAGLLFIPRNLNEEIELKKMLLILKSNYPKSKIKKVRITIEEIAS